MSGKQDGKHVGAGMTMTEAARETGVVPVPREAAFADGFCDFSGGFSILADSRLENEAGLFRLWITEISSGAVSMAGQAGTTLPVHSADSIAAAASTPDGRIAIRLILGNAGKRAQAEAGTVQVEAGTALNEAGKVPGDIPALMCEKESYRLEVLAGEIRISAPEPAGIFYGLVSLRQLAMSYGPVIPCVRIDDSPRFGWRGFMLDTVRNFFRVEFLEKMLDLAAFHKLNIFHWHLTDDQAWRLDIPSRPELSRIGSTRLDSRFNVPQEKAGSYSPADVARVVAFAASRHITVVPEIETPGHALALLASHPELSCRGPSTNESRVNGGANRRESEGAEESGITLDSGAGGFGPADRYGVFDDILCAGNNEVFDLLGDVYDHVASVFPGPWVHAGGDEAPKRRWRSCPRCNQRMEDENLRDADGKHDPEKLQAWFMGRVAQMLSARGKRMIGWDEVLEGGVRKDTVVMSWRGYSGGIEGARAGCDVVMSPQTKACYLDHKHLDLPEEPGQLGICTVRDSWLFDPLPPGLSEKEAGHILGAQANIWTELMYFGRQVEYMAFPRLCALSEAFWSAHGSRDFTDFARRMHEFHEKRLDFLDVNRFPGAWF